ncbi:hypothetical protein EKH55_2588 [Sinorhizobium alkalisoli]|nr:hypothetical protein EKH55_2588 [Sinorhizobium alkalisoli]
MTYRHEHEDTLRLRNTGSHFCQISVNKRFNAFHAVQTKMPPTV